MDSFDFKVYLLSKIPILTWNLFYSNKSTHRYFIEPHIKMLYVLVLWLVISLSNFQKLCIRPLVDLSKHVLRTVLCKNLQSIAQDCNVHSRNLNKFCVNFLIDWEWKLPTLLELRSGLNNFGNIEISTMINFYVPTKNYNYTYFIIAFVFIIKIYHLFLCTKYIYSYEKKNSLNGMEWN